MSTKWGAEVPRLARLARLSLAPDEVAPLAEACARIEAEFSDLEAYAAALPPPPALPPGALREDVAREAPAAEVEGILRASARADPATRLVRVPRGLP